MGGKDVLLAQSQGDGEGELGPPVLGDGDPGAHTVHGHPITISQCTFQAHIAR